jgi:serine protease inhibitor
MIKNSNELSLKMYDHYSDMSESYITSGYSLMNLFAILYGGSDGETKKLFEHVLKMDPSTITDVMKIVKQMSNKSYKQMNLILSDRRIHSEYTDQIKAICNVDSLSGNIAKINDFVEKYTNGLIKDAVNGVSDDVAMFLMNVIYFKSNWVNKFDHDNTRDMQFYGLSKNRDVIMMCQEEVFRYTHNKDYKLLEMDYDDNLYTMGLILPNKHDNLKIEHQVLMNLINDLSRETVDLYVPRFTMKATTNLNNMIKSLGFEQFYDTMSLPKLIDDDKYLNDAIQKIVIMVNEDGTEMAIVTTMEECDGMDDDEPKIKFICDRPFLFYIRNKLNNVIICLGRYA